MSEDKQQEQSRQNILTLLDGFIEQIQQIRRILLGMSLSAIILAPLAIALSVYLILHPSFFEILQIENEFGLILSILLGAVIIISAIWLLTGIKQYYSMNHWKNRYIEYQNEKEAIDKKIASQFGLDQE
ncbi:hypothetical protein Ngar_c33300 [Candidatus Nitrososphaera gargensis Ga9.2]|uniref:Uncharacterized protein n=1 Tax=Nitrososphaera gargensis (strain Ga9.2) TaxID=1237085 RepID=K0IJM4_NITGG|nr:hypothetical protein [Candidatus Nitrososphaera gargensis]AFU60245.1 hypothetical protein Ngar_c33300 [Candidatus Nitrososphaera gargensis Ga9.2]